MSLPESTAAKLQKERMNYLKKRKQHYDAMYQLSASAENLQARRVTPISDNPYGIQLLNEGMIINQDGQGYIYLEKGSIERWHEQLSADFVGEVTIGHWDRAAIPSQVGYWTKNDLTLVKNDSGRTDLFVNPTWIEDSPWLQIVAQQVKATGQSLSVSCELRMIPDEEASELLEVFVAKDIDIYAFSLVGEPGNVFSSQLKF